MNCHVYIPSPEIYVSHAELRELMEQAEGESPVDLWMVYQQRIPADTPRSALQCIKDDFLQQVSFFAE